MLVPAATVAVACPAAAALDRGPPARMGIRPVTGVRSYKVRHSRGTPPHGIFDHRCRSCPDRRTHLGEGAPSKQFHLVDGALRQKPLAGNATAASLAYLPHAAALLEAFAKKYARPGSLRSLTPLYRRLPIDRAVKHLRGAISSGSVSTSGTFSIP